MTKEFCDLNQILNCTLIYELILIKLSINDNMKSKTFFKNKVKYDVLNVIENHFFLLFKSKLL